MYFDELKVGMSIDIEPIEIKEDEMLDFSYKYDNVPLHTDREYAKTTPFKRLIAPGVMSFMVVWNKYLEHDFFGNELLAGKSTKIEWHKPIFAGDVLSSKATITNLVKRNEKNGIATVSFEVYNQNNELVLTNDTEAIVKCKID